MKENYTIDDANCANIINIANHFLESELSLRVFAKKYCDFSYVTLREKLLTVLPNANQDLYSKVITHLENRKSKNIKDDLEAKRRVLKATNLLLNDNFTVTEIALKLETTEMSIYRDLTRRLLELEEVSEDIKKQVLLRLEEHSLQNLRGRINK